MNPTKLYEFTVSDPHGLPLQRIWEMAWDSAAEQEVFEHCMGEPSWPKYRVVITDVLFPIDPKDTIQYLFEVWLK